jgi:hypothetical protein
LFIRNKLDFYSISFEDHGADDDLKLLNVIEVFCKTKPRQSINVHVQDVISSAVNKSSSLQPGQKPTESSSEAHNIQNFVGTTTQTESSSFVANKVVDKHLQKLMEEKKYVNLVNTQFIREFFEKKFFI